MTPHNSSLRQTWRERETAPVKTVWCLFTRKSECYRLTSFKGIIQPMMKLLASFLHSHVVLNLLGFLYSLEGDVWQNVQAARFHIIKMHYLF